MLSLPYKTILTLALISALSPFLGLPGWWRSGVPIVAGLIIFVLVGIAYHRERRILKEDEQKYFASEKAQVAEVPLTENIDGISASHDAH